MKKQQKKAQEEVEVEVRAEVEEEVQADEEAVQEKQKLILKRRSQRKRTQWKWMMLHQLHHQ